MMKKKICFSLIIFGVVIVLASCSSNSSPDTPIPKRILLYPYGNETPYDESSGSIAASRFIEIRVIDQTGQYMANADLFVSTDSSMTYQALSKNSDGKWLIDPTEKTVLAVKVGDVCVQYTLNTDNLIKIDLESSSQFNGMDPPEYQGAFHTQDILMLSPCSLLSSSTVPLNLYHILYQVDWQDARVEIQRVSYEKDFILNLADFSDVTSMTTCVFKNTLAIIENNRIVYETGLSREATILFFY